MRCSQLISSWQVSEGSSPCRGQLPAPFSGVRPANDKRTRGVQLACPGQLARARHSIAVMAASSADSTQPTVPVTKAKNRGLEYTSYESNSWMASFSLTGTTVLVDPWLVDYLVFGDAPWLYKGGKKVFQPGPEAAKEVAAKADIILLTQALPDHAHVPTLQVLPKTIPVVASEGAAALATSLGFKNVISVDHGQQTTVCDGKLTVKATAGALVGPPWSKRENGFVIQENVDAGVKLYYEPHCDFDESSVSSVGPVDVVVSPPTSQILGGYPLVKGATDNVKLLQLLRPSFMIALMNADITAEGLLSAVIVEQGSLDQLRQEISQAGLKTQVVVPDAATPVPLEL